MSRREKLVYWVQALGARAVMAVFAALPLDAASWLGGLLARKIGPFAGAHKTAVSNLAAAFPDMSEAARLKIIDGVWDNIGRTVAEYPHLLELLEDPRRIEIFDPTAQGRKLAEDGIGGLLLGMHGGNWELSTVPGMRAGLTARHFYRAPNNPYVDKMLRKFRDGIGQDGMLPKGAAGARAAAKLLKEGVHIGMLVDQKQDEGVAVSFFGRDAMTTTAPAALARRLDLPIAAARVVRLRGAMFRIMVEGVPVSRTGDREADVLATTKQISDMLERWIREYPEQWFWVHRRWRKG